MSRVQRHKSKKVIPVIAAAVLVLALLAALWFLVLNRKYTVSFNTSGGSSVASVRVKKGETVSRPEDPVKEGYEFKEWVCSGSSYDFSAPVYSDLTVFAVYKESVRANSIYFLKDTFYVSVNGSVSAGIVLDPVNASAPVHYSSTDPSVAVIDGNGRIRGIAAGETTVTVQIEELSATAKVVVSSVITSLEFEAEEYTVAVGSSIPAVVLVYPEDTEDKIVSYISTDTNIVRFDNGIIYGESEGEAIIVAAAKNGVEARTRVVVKKAVESIALEPGQTVLELAEGKSFVFSVKYYPEDALPVSYRWSSSDTTIADVDRSGVVTPKRPGSVTITCIGSNNVIARAGLRVVRRAESVSAAAYNVELLPGESADLSSLLDFAPADAASGYTAAWKIKSGSSDISLDGSGIVTGLKPTGQPAVVEALLTGLLGDTHMLEFRISVAPVPVSSVELEGFASDENVKIVLSPGETYKIRAKVLPADATDQNLTYSLDFSGISESDAEASSCVKLAADGTLTALHGFAGRCIVVIRGANGVSRTLEVCVNEELLRFEAAGKVNPSRIGFSAAGKSVPISFTRVSYENGKKNSLGISPEEVEILDSSGRISSVFLFSEGCLVLKSGTNPAEVLPAEIVFRCGTLKSAAVSCSLGISEE